jgi:hypothetical protein
MKAMIQIPYAEIGTGIALILVIWGILASEGMARLIILALALPLFLLPMFISSAAPRLICFVGRLLLGIGCYIYIKYQNTAGSL